MAHLGDDVGVGDGEEGGAGGAGIVLGEDGGRGGELGSSTIEVVDEDVGDAVPGVFRVVHARADHALVAEGGEGEGERAGGVAVREERRRGLRSVAREGEGVGDGVDGGGGAVGGVAMARAETRRGARLEVGRLERQRGGRGERRGRDERTHERRQARRRRSEATPGSRARRRGGGAGSRAGDIVRRRRLVRGTGASVARSIVGRAPSRARDQHRTALVVVPLAAVNNHERQGRCRADDSATARFAIGTRFRCLVRPRKIDRNTLSTRPVVL